MARVMGFIVVLTSLYSLFLICFIAVFRWNLKLTSNLSNTTANSSYWSSWQPWSSCSTSCVRGVKRRMRLRLTSDGSGCSGSETMTRKCSNPVCFGRQLSFLFLSPMWSISGRFADIVQLTLSMAGNFHSHYRTKNGRKHVSNQICLKDLREKKSKKSISYCCFINFSLTSE